MMIIPDTQTLGLGAPVGETATPSLSTLSGRFGLFHAHDAPICSNLDTAAMGYMAITPDTLGNPVAGNMAYGMVQTLNSLGAGDDGKRVIPPVGGAKEWVIQVLFMADGSLYTRCRVNNNAFQSFIKRW